MVLDHTNPSRNFYKEGQQRLKSANQAFQLMMNYKVPLQSFNKVALLFSFSSNISFLELPNSLLEIQIYYYVMQEFQQRKDLMSSLLVSNLHWISQSSSSYFTGDRYLAVQKSNLQFLIERLVTDHNRYYLLQQSFNLRMKHFLSSSKDLEEV